MQGQGENVKNAPELQSIQVRFRTQKSRKCTQNFFCKPCNAKTSKMHLNFTANRFVFGHIYRNIAPGTFFCKPFMQRTSKMRLNLAANSFVFGCKNWKNAPRTSLKTLQAENSQNASELSVAYAVNWEQLQSWKYIPYIFEKIFKLCFVKFSPVKEIVSMKCKCLFSKFLSAGMQKRCRKCCFFRLRKNTSYNQWWDSNFYEQVLSLQDSLTTGSLIMYQSLQNQTMLVGPIIGPCIIYKCKD